MAQPERRKSLWSTRLNRFSASFTNRRSQSVDLGQANSQLYAFNAAQSATAPPSNTATLPSGSGSKLARTASFHAKEREHEFVNPVMDHLQPPVPLAATDRLKRFSADRIGSAGVESTYKTMVGTAEDLLTVERKTVGLTYTNNQNEVVTVNAAQLPEPFDLSKVLAASEQAAS